MNGFRVLSIVLLAHAACGCTPGAGSAPGSNGPEAGTTAGLERDDQVLEAVLLHELQAANPSPAEGVCLRVRTGSGADGDASDALVAAIARRYPAARKASQCEGGGPTPVRVNATGAAGVMFDVGPVKWDSGDVALVEGGGGSRGGSLSIREVEYKLERKGGSFRVTSERVMRQN